MNAGEAMGRLAGRFRRGSQVLAGPNVRAVALALWSDGYYADGGPAEQEDGISPELRAELRAAYGDVTDDDIVDALRLVQDYRREVDHAIKTLIKASRARRPPISWERIGMALGYPRATARQNARRWAKRLDITIGPKNGKDS